MNDVPRPRILFEDVPDDQLLSELARSAGTYGVFGKDVEAVHASDWDLVVSFHRHPEEPDGVHVLSFGGTSFGEVAFDVATGSILVEPSRRAVLHARTTASAEGLSSA